jgi:hypothetical protein
MDKKVAQLISLIFSPEVVLSVGILTLVSASNLTQFTYAISFLAIGGLPPLIYGIYTYLRERDSIVEPSRKVSLSIYLLAVFSFTSASIFFGVDLVYNAFWSTLAMIMTSFFAITYLVTRYFDKFSMHVAMYAFVTMLLMDQLHTSFGSLFIFAPLIIWARLRLHKLTWLEIMWGWAIGLTVGMLAWTL